MKKKNLYSVAFEVVTDEGDQKPKFGWSWELSKYKYVYIVAETFEEALAYARKHFNELASKVKFADNERPVDIREVALFKGEIYA